ncbi:hypothetical protein GQ457_14G025290 [Hibiscus cannabinus]
MASSSSSPPMKHQVFLSFRGEDTRLNFTSHLRKALKDAGMSVFFDEDTLERGEEISPALSRAIEASRLSIVVLSSDYASSKSCLAELSDIMHRKATQEHIVLPIFYHVDPSHVRNLGGSFKKSFDDHESKRLHQVQRWKTAFVDVGKLKGWHIEGGKFDKHESNYIKEIVDYVIKELSSSQSETVSKDYVGIDNQKEAILNLIKKEDSRVVGLWGMGGIEEKLRIDGPLIGSSYQERLNNKRVIVVLDDVNDSEQVKWMGVEHFGDGSKIIITSRDIQVLKNARAGDNIYEVKKLHVNVSLQLFSTFAFQQLKPAADFLDLSYKFVAYADGIPLALKVLGSKLFSKSRKVWKSEVDKLKQYPEPKISHILMSSFDELDEVQKNIFLDIACFFKGESWNDVEDILSYWYRGAVSGISSLFDKSLLDINSYGHISMHDMFEEIAKEIVCKESEHIGKRSSGNDSGGRFEKFRTEFFRHEACKGDHVWILCNKNMVREDKNYEEASFEFQIIDFEGGNIEVEKCGVKDVEHAVAGSSIYVVGPDDALEDVCAKVGKGSMCKHPPSALWKQYCWEGFCSRVDKISIGGRFGINGGCIFVNVKLSCWYEGNSDAWQIFGKGHLYFDLSLYKNGATKSYTNQNFDSQNDANTEEVHDHSATETRFSHNAGAEIRSE